MTRMRYIIVAISAVIIAGCLATLAFAQDVAAAVIAPSSMFYDLWTIVQPLVVLFGSIVGPVLVTWIAARLINLLKVTDDKQKADLEGSLRTALHQSAVNAVKYAITKAGRPGLAGGISAQIIDEAVSYVQSKNPETIDKLKVDGDALRDIVLSKVPDLMKAAA